MLCSTTSHSWDEALRKTTDQGCPATKSISRDFYGYMGPFSPRKLRQLSEMFLLLPSKQQCPQSNIRSPLACEAIALQDTWRVLQGWEACHAGTPLMPGWRTRPLWLMFTSFTSVLQLGRQPCSQGPTAVAAAQPELVCTSRSCNGVRPYQDQHASGEPLPPLPAGSSVTMSPFRRRRSQYSSASCCAQAITHASPFTCASCVSHPAVSIRGYVVLGLTF